MGRREGVLRKTKTAVVSKEDVYARRSATHRSDNRNGERLSRGDIGACVGNGDLNLLGESGGGEGSDNSEELHG